jgi:hypothetical protein
MRITLRRVLCGTVPSFLVIRIRALDAYAHGSFNAVVADLAEYGSKSFVRCVACYVKCFVKVGGGEGGSGG